MGIQVKFPNFFFKTNKQLFDPRTEREKETVEHCNKPSYSAVIYFSRLEVHTSEHKYKVHLCWFTLIPGIRICQEKKWRIGRKKIKQHAWIDGQMDGQINRWMEGWGLSWITICWDVLSYLFYFFPQTRHIYIWLLPRKAHENKFTESNNRWAVSA